MSNSTRPGDASWSPSLALAIEEACNRFEVAWQAGGVTGAPPLLEDFLGDLPEPDRSALRRELAALDAECRGIAADPVQTEDAPPVAAASGAGGFAPTFAGVQDTPRAAPRPTATPTSASSSESGVQVRCPHCHNPLVLSDKRPDEVLCPACGGSFRLREARQTSTESGMRPLGKFQLLERVGLGAFGAVWRARDTELDRIVALKIPHASLLQSEADLERFHREARAAAQLRHPGIVTVHEVQMLEGLPTIVADFIEGVPLRDLLESRKLTFRESALLLAEVAEAVDYANGMGLVHRDIKPANIMVDRSHLAGAKTGEEVSASEPRRLGRPLIMDFGLALRPEAEVTLTLDGHIIGTPAYMSPEQASGKGHQADRRSDVYSLGVILYELLTGELPFRGSKVMIMHQVLSEEPKPPRRLNDRIPRDLETVCLKCLEKEPAGRYQTALELANELRHWLRGEPIRERPPGAWERAWKWAKRRPAMAALLIVSAVATVALVGLAIGLWYQAELQGFLERETAAKDKVQEALDGETAAKKELRTALYFNRIVMAEREWSANNVGRAEQLLSQCDPDLRGWEWNYLHSLCHIDLRTISGHKSMITGVAYSPDGLRLASSAEDEKIVKIWDATTGRFLFDLPDHTQPVWDVAYSSDGQWIASVSGLPIHPGELKVWDAATGKCIRTMPRRIGKWCRVAFNPDSTKIAAASGELATGAEVTVWDIRPGKEPLILHHSAQAVLGVAFSPDKRYLASASGSIDTAEIDKKPGELKVWDLESGKEIRIGPGSVDAAITSVAFSPKGKQIAYGVADGTVRTYEMNRKEAGTLRGHTGKVLSLAFHADGRRLASASADQTVRIWDVASGAELLTLRGHQGPVRAVAFHPLLDELVSGGLDGTLKVWDAVKPRDVLTLSAHSGPTSGVAFSPDRKWFASASIDRTVKVWDAATFKPICRLGPHSSPVWGIVFSPDSRLLVSTGGDWRAKGKPGEVRIWDVGTWTQARPALTIDAGKDPGIAWTAAFSPPDGRFLAVSCGEYASPGEVRIFDTRTWNQQQPSIRQQFGVGSVAYSPDGQHLALPGTNDNAVWLVELATGGKTSLRGHTNAVMAVALSPDGKQLASASEDQTVRVWDLGSDRTGKVTAAPLVLEGHTAGVHWVAFSPDGQRIASGSDDGTVRVWDAATGQECVTLRGHKEGVNWVAFSPDGKRLVSSSPDMTVKVWDGTPWEQEPGRAAGVSGK